MSDRKDELERIPRPALNGRQMACVNSKFALTETPAIAHFAAVHHHVDEILKTLAVNDNPDWIRGNINRVKADLFRLEMAMAAGEVPLDLTDRHDLTRLRTAFVGIPSGLRQSLDASKGQWDHSVAYRPWTRKDISPIVSAFLIVCLVALGLWIFN
ncbi:hypothetical protein ABT039_22850 [Streptomyces lasiicapitis]|uniref:hypothetical protein n=1 Tax=Streptomyces lasiicapitis TaxID=1923961 RepID=UPI0033274691